MLKRTTAATAALLAGAALTGVALAGVALTGCALGDDGETTLDVFAAASLARAVAQVAEVFEAAHDGVRVRVSPGGSPDLVAQVLAGAPADVVITADERTLARLLADDHARHDLGIGDPVVVATNTPALVTPADDPGRIGSLSDAATARLVVCAPAVPCGDAAARLAAAAGVVLAPVSEETSVTDVLAKVTSGEADAGIVFRTDALAGVAAGTLREVPVDGAGDVVTRAPAVTLGGPEAALARAFVDTLTGPEGRRVLREAGFGAP